MAVAAISKSQLRLIKQHTNAACLFSQIPRHGISTSSPIRLESDLSLKDPSARKPNPQDSTAIAGPISAQSTSSGEPLQVDLNADENVRLPRSVQAVYLKPLRRTAQYGVPCCDLQLRSYSIRNLELFSDFALRAAYYLNLPAAGPVPLPRITERWTVPRSNFAHKKSQENFERITLRRMIQIYDGHPETVETWLAFLKKHAYYGIGMKANVWEHESLGVGKTMDVSLENIKNVLEPKWAHFGRKKNLETSAKVVEMMNSEKFQQTLNGAASNVTSDPA